MDVAQLQALVERSILLSPEEKKFWLQSLQTMRGEQMEKLEQILTEAEKIPLKESVQKYFQAVEAATPPLAA